MIKIYKFKLAIPLLLVKTKVSHTTPREPTTFERLILELSQRKNSLKDYQSMPLLAIFKEVLRIPEPNDLLQPAFNNLANLQILHGYYDDLSQLTLSDIQLQDNANVNYLITHGQIPAQPKEDMIDSIYDPVKGELLSSIQDEAKDRHSIPTLPESLIGNFFPDKLIRDKLTPKNYKWLTNTSKITDVTEITDEREFKYKNVELELGFDGQKLTLVSKDEVLNKFLNNLSADIYSKVIKEAVNLSNNQSINTDGLISDQALSVDESRRFLNSQLNVTSLKNIKNTKGKLLSGSKVLIHGGSDTLKIDLPEGEAALTIDSLDNEKPQLHWEAGKANLTSLNFQLPLGVQWLEGDFLTSTMFSKQVADLQLLDADGNLYVLSMFGESKLQANNPLYENLLDHINSLVEHSDDEAWQNLSVFLIPASQLWQKWINQSVSSSIEESIISLKKRYELLGLVNGKPPGQMVNDLFQWLKNKLKDETPLSKIKLMRAVEFAQLIGLQEKKVNSDFIEWLQENSQYPKNYLELSEYAEITEPLGRIKPNSRWLSPKLLREWQKSCGEEGFSKVLDYLPVAEAFNNLHESLVSLRACFSDSWLRFMGDKQALTGLVRETYSSVNHQINFGKLRSYQRNYDKQIQSLAAYPVQIDTNQSKPLVYQVRQAVDTYLNEALKPDFALEAATKVFVVDSCFLIRKPDLPKMIKHGEVLLVPDKVHEELDNLKAKNKKQGVVVSASKAIKALADNKLGNVFTIQASLDKLPISYERHKPDNIILAAVLTYRKYSPILLSDDKNFINKARGLEIPSLTVKEYLEGITPSTELSSAIKKSESLKG